MKKVIYLLVLMFSLTLMSTSCEKDDPTPVQTLEQLYPDWTNLTWVSTEKKGVFVRYPRLDIKIVGDTVFFNFTTEEVGTYYLKYESFNINIEGTEVTFDKSKSAKKTIMTIETPPDDTKVKLTMDYYGSTTFVLRKN